MNPETIKFAEEYHLQKLNEMRCKNCVHTNQCVFKNSIKMFAPDNDVPLGFGCTYFAKQEERKLK